MGDFEHLLTELTLAAPADAEAIARLRDEYGAHIPDDYLAFLSAHDGAEGAVGVLVPAAEVGRGAELYPELDHLHDFVIFGSDGGGEAFAFTSSGVVVVPWIGDADNAILQGTFTKFLDRLVEGRLFDRDR